MDRTKLKNYAAQARRDFIQAVTDRASLYGLSPKTIEPVTEKGDVVIIAGRAFPASAVARRRALEVRIERNGFAQTMEALAYTWFNRFVAIRFMELHGYLDHGYRVLSNPDLTQTVPEMLDRAEHVDLEGLDKEKVIDLKLDGSKEAELYQMMLVAQCNALHSAMPFLFERIDDETELVLPDNLLHSDSVIRKLVNEVGEEDWKEVEIIGWLYQFYISEKKAEVIGKVVASGDIPAATQLFTPNWIVKYLVQNTLGRLWLGTYPQSPLRQQMKYYIEPAEQAPEVQEQLKSITPTSLNPEELTLLDPAGGSGHILVEAYDLFKAIYQERGYRAKDIPALILHKNLVGLEIDTRAAQLAAFALMMKARADDRRIFDIEAKPNILAFEESKGMNAADITNALNAPINKEGVTSEYLFEELEEEKAGLFSKKALAEKGYVSQGDIASLLELFENAKTFGSLIQVPPILEAKLSEIERRLNYVLKHGDLTHASAHVIKPLLQQAQLLATQYDAVVANPPYMGRRNGMNRSLKDFGNRCFPRSSADLYAMFIERGFAFVNRHGFTGIVAMHSWLFLPTFESMRESVLKEHTFDSLAHLGPRAFSSISGEVVQVAAFSIRSEQLNHYRPVFLRLLDGDETTKSNNLLERKGVYENVLQSDFVRLPGSPIAYWASNSTRLAFERGTPLKQVASPRSGLGTTNNDKFLRLWFEVRHHDICFAAEGREDARQSGAKWFPYNKGGTFRKWYGNNEYVVDWLDDGRAIKEHIKDKNPNVARGESNYFKPSITWTDLGSSRFGVRRSPKGFIFDTSGSSAFPRREQTNLITGFLCSAVALHFLAILNPTMHFQVGNVGNLPVLFLGNEPLSSSVDALVEKAVKISEADWDASETSWNFQRNSLLDDSIWQPRVGDSVAKWHEACNTRIHRLHEIECENNRIFIEAYDLQDELSPKVHDDEITLYVPDRTEDIKRLISYAIGCEMGRFSLDKPGLIYVDSGNQSFDPSQYKTFRADDHGIIPLLETDWGVRGDATNLIVEFIGVAWPKEHLEENLRFIADSLGPTSNEKPRDTIRHYLATGFYKHHLSMYRKRPIYWLFCSGKQQAFQCHVYLHRYNEGTLSRMRTEHVIPLQGKLASYIDQLASDIQNATATSHRKKLEKKRDTLLKEQTELRVFDEKLRHYADLRINLDLDDGVKVNYGKFGDLLAEVNAVTGGSDD